MSLEGVILSFVGEKWKYLPFLGRTRNSVPVPKGGGGGGVPVPIGERKSGTDIDQSGTVTGASSNPIFVPLALLSLVFVHRLFRDPNKGLIGVHIRVYERENILYLFASAIFI